MINLYNMKVVVMMYLYGLKPIIIALSFCLVFLISGCDESTNELDQDIEGSWGSPVFSFSSNSSLFADSSFVQRDIVFDQGEFELREEDFGASYSSGELGEVEYFYGRYFVAAEVVSDNGVLAYPVDLVFEDDQGNELLTLFTLIYVDQDLYFSQWNSSQRSYDLDFDVPFSRI